MTTMKALWAVAELSMILFLGQTALRDVMEALMRRVIALIVVEVVMTTNSLGEGQRLPAGALLLLTSLAGVDGFKRRKKHAA
jgi:hypothetical protein